MLHDSKYTPVPPFNNHCRSPPGPLTQNSPSPGLLGHLVLVRPGQLVQVRLQDGLHLLMVGGAQGGGGRLAEGRRHGRRGTPFYGRGGAVFLLPVVVQVGLDVQGRGPAVAVVPAMGTEGGVHVGPFRQGASESLTENHVSETSDKIQQKKIV